ncbi:MAG: SPOR domain-containing protein, partial [Shewanella sp.]
ASHMLPATEVTKVTEMAEALAPEAADGAEAANAVATPFAAEPKLAGHKLTPEPKQAAKAVQTVQTVQAEGTQATDAQAQTGALKPTTGYTVQIASVSQRRTLDSLLQDLTAMDKVRVAKNKRYWVVLVGEYDSASSAQKAAAQLVKDYRIDKPWVRKWSELAEYQLQEALAHREISE